MGVFLSLLVLIFGFICIVFFLFKIVEYGYAYLFWGAIYVSTSEERVQKMIRFLDLKSGKIKKAADLGAGDGRLVIALAKAGVEAHGYEINPFLVFLGRKNIKKAGLENKAFMHLKNLWQVDVQDFDAVILYAMTHMMKKLEKKMDKELRQGSVIVSNYFVFPRWKAVRVVDGISLYVKDVDKLA